MYISKQALIHITTKNLWARKDHLFQLHCSHPGHQHLPPTSAPVSCYGSAKTELKSAHSSAWNLPTSSFPSHSSKGISFKGLQSVQDLPHLLLTSSPTTPLLINISTLRVQVTLQKISLHGVGV
uniref:Uncharacterized protein n=1 Tax=Pipistrellus kuhlii TaxID=59472 RepID=A0A7J7WDF2_PIPKU|nr:hypothetical protein mPipKuh1_008076 [Pipistrellus kuhlii]